MTLLEILIPSVPERADKVERLKATLLTQIGNLNVTISIYITDSVKKGGQTIGFKRQHLLQNSTSKYVAFIDDDDIVSDDYISQIYNALKTNPDVVTFNGFITTNGLKKGKMGNKGRQRLQYEKQCLLPTTKSFITYKNQNCSCYWLSCSFIKCRRL